jgi:hypothetical protein
LYSRGIWNKLFIIWESKIYSTSLNEKTKTKNLPNLTSPDTSSIPFPNSAEPQVNKKIFYVTCPKKSPKFGKISFGATKYTTYKLGLLPKMRVIANKGVGEFVSDYDKKKWIMEEEKVQNEFEN